MAVKETHTARVLRQIAETPPPVPITAESVCPGCGKPLQLPHPDAATSDELLAISMEFGLVPWPEEVTHLHDCWRCHANLSGYKEDEDA